MEENNNSVIRLRITLQELGKAQYLTMLSVVRAQSQLDTSSDEKMRAFWQAQIDEARSVYESLTRGDWTIEE